jgi:hypothetical protein
LDLFEPIFRVWLFAAVGVILPSKTAKGVLEGLLIRIAIKA